MRACSTGLPFLSLRYRMNTKKPHSSNMMRNLDLARIYRRQTGRLCIQPERLCNMARKPVGEIGDHLRLVQFVDALLSPPLGAFGLKIDDAEFGEGRGHFFKPSLHPEGGFLQPAKKIDR